MYVSTFSVSSAFAYTGLSAGSKSSSVMLSDWSWTGTIRALAVDPSFAWVAVEAPQ